jgi:hypothetical protein
MLRAEICNPLNTKLRLGLIYIHMQDVSGGIVNTFGSGSMDLNKFI